MFAFKAYGTESEWTQPIELSGRKVMQMKVNVAKVCSRRVRV